MNRTHAESRQAIFVRIGVIAAAVAGGMMLASCISAPPPDDGGTNLPIFNNTTDPTNGGASYVGSAACGACHPSYADLVRLHGHHSALSPIEDESPDFPAAAKRASVPAPPDDIDWVGISYVIGGYLKNAIFVDRDGYVLTDGTVGSESRWLLDFPQNGTTPGFNAYLPEQTDPLSFDYECFRCHTTGPMAFDPDDPRHQDNRPGINGTWAEAGVQCEACHGPGSHHVPNPAARNIYVSLNTDVCAKCHLDGDDPNVIVAADGYVSPYAQVAELRASGGHASFTCGVCHDSHAGTTYDRERGLRNECTTCHTDQNMAFHEGFVLVRGDYVEPVTCESCHMPYSGLSGSSASAEFLGQFGGRVGDVRSHIFRIDTEHADYTGMFSDDGTYVVKDADGRAAVTADFVCQRCHNTGGDLFPLTADGARRIAIDIHKNAAAKMANGN